MRQRFVFHATPPPSELGHTLIYFTRFHLLKEFSFIFLFSHILSSLSAMTFSQGVACWGSTSNLCAFLCFKPRENRKMNDSSFTRWKRQSNNAWMWKGTRNKSFLLFLQRPSPKGVACLFSTSAPFFALSLLWGRRANAATPLSARGFLVVLVVETLAEFTSLWKTLLRVVSSCSFGGEQCLEG